MKSLVMFIKLDAPSGGIGQLLLQDQRKRESLLDTLYVCTSLVQDPVIIEGSRHSLKSLYPAVLEDFRFSYKSKTGWWEGRLDCGNYAIFGFPTVRLAQIPLVC